MCEPQPRSFRRKFSEVEMVIEPITWEGVLKVSRESLGLSPSRAPADDELLAALLRRAASILCPCSPATLIAFVLDGLQYLLEGSYPKSVTVLEVL